MIRIANPEKFKKHLVAPATLLAIGASAVGLLKMTHTEVPNAQEIKKGPYTTLIVEPGATPDSLSAEVNPNGYIGDLAYEEILKQQGKDGLQIGQEVVVSDNAVHEPGQ